MARREELTEAQWERIAPLILAPARRPDGHGWPGRGNREV